MTSFPLQSPLGPRLHRLRALWAFGPASGIWHRVAFFGTMDPKIGRGDNRVATTKCGRIFAWAFGEYGNWQEPVRATKRLEPRCVDCWL